MSTRATYSFEYGYYNKIITFYIHYDNYPEGAAYYFWQLYKNRQYKGGLTEAFITANPSNVEFTEGHEFHGDTEYRYSMKKNGFLIAEKEVSFDLNEKNKFTVFFEGHYAEFINQYGNLLSEYFEDFEMLHKLSEKAKEAYAFSYLTLSEIGKIIEGLKKDVSSGHKCSQENLSIWMDEYQRLTDISKDK